MNILYISHRIPYPPNKGDKIRSFHQIVQLSRNHRVHLACLIDRKEDVKHIDALKQYCASIDWEFRGKTVARLYAIRSLISDKPLSVGAFYSRRLSAKIANRLKTAGIDRIVVFSSVMAEYVKHVAHIPKIMDFVDVDSDKWKLYASHRPFPLSRIYALEARRLAHYEETVAEDFDCSIFISEKEAALFKERGVDMPIAVISNGVNADYYSPNGSHANEPAMVFVGEMDYFPNVDAVIYFCREVFPLVRRVLPEACFFIVGRNPTRQVRALNQLTNVIVTGSVSDVRPFLLKSCVSVAPFRVARGLQNKVLEAMAMALPVVGTSQAFQGISANESDGIRIADTPERLADAIVELITNPDLRNRCSHAARSYIEQKHQWKDQGVKLESLLRTIG